MVVAVVALAGLTPVSGGRALTLEEVVRAAVSAHPTVLAADAAEAVAVENIDQARAGYLPSVDSRIGLGFDHFNDQGTRFRRTRGVGGPSTVRSFHQDGSLTVSQMLFDGFETENQVASAEARRENAHFIVLDTAEAIALRAIDAFFAVKRAREILTLAEQNVVTHEGVVRDVRLRADAGGGNFADVLQAESRLSLARSRVADQMGLLRESEADYVEAVGVWPDNLEVGDPPAAALPDELTFALSRALAQNPALKAADKAVTARRSDARAAEGVFVPRFDLELSASTDNNIEGTRGSSASLQALVVMRFNLFSGGGDSARLSGARRQVSQTIMEEQETRRLIEEQIRVDWARLQTARQRLPYLEERVVSAAQVVSAYRQQFNLGQRSLLDVLDTENELFQAQADLVDGTYDLHFAHWAVLASMGDILATMDIAPSWTGEDDESSEWSDPLLYRE